MVSSAARSVSEYLASLPEDRRAAVSAVRDLVNRALPAGFEEGMQYGMISWFVPFTRYPVTYNKQPLAILALASQKQYMSLYLMGVYSEPGQSEAFEEAWTAAGKRLNMGKACLRFKRLDDLALDVLADVIAATSVDAFIARYEAARLMTKAGKKTAAKKAAAKNAASKKTASKKTTANKTAAEKKISAKKTASKKTTANKTAANKTASNKTASKKTASKKTAAKKATSKKTASKKTAAKKATSKKTASKKTAANKTASKKTASKKTAANKTAAKNSASRKKTAAKSGRAREPLRAR